MRRGWGIAEGGITVDGRRVDGGLLGVLAWRV